MGLKTIFTVVIAAGAVVYGAKSTQSQTFYQCDGKFGHAELVNPNRYSVHMDRDLHLSVTSADGATRRYAFNHAPMAPLLIDEVRQLCRTGKPAAGLRLIS